MRLTSDTTALRIADLIGAPLGPRLRGIDAHWVAILEELGPDAWPSILVDGEGRVIDGWHRIEAARGHSLEELTVEVRAVESEGEFLEAAALANRHGLPLRASERRMAAESLLILSPGWSDRRIAMAVGVSPTSIGTWRSSQGVQNGHLARNGELRIGRDGKRYPLTPALRRPPAVATPVTTTARTRAWIGRIVRWLLRQFRSRRSGGSG